MDTTLLQKQINYYLNCTETEKTIIKAFALKTTFDHEVEIQRLLDNRIYLTQKAIKDVLKCAIDMGIISTPENRYGWTSKKYTIAQAFMVYVIPFLGDFKKEWADVNEKTLSSIYFFDNYSEITNVRSFLYELLFETKINDNLIASMERKSHLFSSLRLYEYPAYMACIDKLNLNLVETIYNAGLNDMLFEMQPFEQVVAFDKLFEENFGTLKYNQISMYVDVFELYKAQFLKSTADVPMGLSNFACALHYLANNNSVQAFKYFDAELQSQRKINKHVQLFATDLLNLFYFIALLSQDTKTQLARVPKIQQYVQKYMYGNLASVLLYITNTIQNKKDDKLYLQSKIRHAIMNSADLEAVALVSFAYVADVELDKLCEDRIVGMLEKAYIAENYLFGYEAAFVANKWFQTNRTADMLARFASMLNYQPLCSAIVRSEEWEIKLNIMMNALGGNKATKNGVVSAENNSRVVYIFSPNYSELQPVLQTRNAKGVWSKGRNIAMKTFYAANVQGMTEQDFRIAKSIVHSKGGYYDADSYDFEANVFVEIIGHPYVYLEGANDVIMEFVGAQPVISVVRNINGYVLKSDVALRNAGVNLIKETNTRYRVYNISQPQLTLISTIADGNFCVPEQGKDKLITLIGQISKYATVHSDLLQSESSEKLNVKSIKPDKRIRVQLLPFGDGLKAELFVKPFADFPPYAKPGKGGKVLIANVNNEQLQVERDLRGESILANSLMVDIESLESVSLNDDLIAFDNPLDSLHLLDVLHKHKENCVVEWPEGERFKIKSKVEFKNLSIQIKTKNNWFELDGELRVDEDNVLTLQQLLQLMPNKHDRFVELKQGEFLALSNEMRKRLDELRSFANVNKKSVQINKFASMALGDFFDSVPNLKADKAWKDFRKRIEAADTVEAKVPATLQAELRPYQQDGFRWMAGLAEWEAGACLADDMGLGKTVQTLAILLHRATKGPALVVCPVSVVGNWVAEAMRFAPTLNVRTLNNANRQQTIDELCEGDVLISSYGLLQSEEKMFVEKHFATAVLDEAHIIKNYSTKTSKATMQLKADFRLALTGTPLQNHQGEIWNLFNFVNPGLLGSLNEFNDNFIKPNNDTASKMLKKLIQPFILRRTKTAVLDELPPKTEIIKKVQLSEQEMAFYEALRRQAILNLEASESGLGAKNIQALAEITKLRQASCNPLLVDKNIKIPSSKLSTFLEIADELIENKHRALVFSQFVSHLAIVRAALDAKGIHYKYLDGATPVAEREKLVRSFQSGEGDLFLISLKAGGLGLNLTAADYVIHLDPWWNPAIEDQASDRAHRIGQKRPVTIYRLVAENTIEEKIIKLHNSKRDLAESLLEGSDQSAKLSLNELMDLIKETW